VNASRRELDLLRWLCTVRNKAIQHRAEEGYTGGCGVVMPSRFALLSATDQRAEGGIADRLPPLGNAIGTLGRGAPRLVRLV
jgi:hypothetical protein